MLGFDEFEAARNVDSVLENLTVADMVDGCCEDWTDAVEFLVDLGV